jgi:hypothetical protein
MKVFRHAFMSGYAYTIPERQTILREGNSVKNRAFISRFVFGAKHMRHYSTDSDKGSARR